MPALIASLFFFLYFYHKKDKGLDRILVPLKFFAPGVSLHLHFQIPSRAAVFSISLPLPVADCQYVLFLCNKTIQVYVHYDYGRSSVLRGEGHAVSEQANVRIS